MSRRMTVMLLGLLLVSGRSWAQTQPASAVKSATTQTVSDPDGIRWKFGFIERIRHEFWKNIFDYANTTKDNQNYFRLRTSLWGQVDFNKDTDVYLRLTGEYKGYNYYAVSNVKKGMYGDINEYVVDNFYTDLKNVFNSPVSLRVGRQDFLNQYGEGFLIQDGTPLDGSRTYYFNAIKGSWVMDDRNTVDFIYLNDPKNEKTFPIINPTHSDRALNISNEQGYVLYWKNKGIDKLSFEPYFIYKDEDRGGSRLQGQKGRISTPGVYAKYDLDPYTLRGQVAYQTGYYGLNDRQAIGGYAFVDRVFKDVNWSPKLTAGYVYLSGDDPKTSKNEGWDSLWGRWPMWSELYLLSYNSESGMGYWTNLQMPRVMAEVNPTKKLKIQTTYNYLMANENPTGTAFAAGDGKNRGHLPQVKVAYTFNQNVSTYFLAEYLIPGNFYANTADPALFLRTECLVKF